jgi:hypothetical protein
MDPPVVVCAARSAVGCEGESDITSIVREHWDACDIRLSLAPTPVFQTGAQTPGTGPEHGESFSPFVLRFSALRL